MSLFDGNVITEEYLEQSGFRCCGTIYTKTFKNKFGERVDVTYYIKDSYFSSNRKKSDIVVNTRLTSPLGSNNIWREEIYRKITDTIEFEKIITKHINESI